MEELKSINSAFSFISELEKVWVEETVAAMILSDTVVGIRQEELGKLPFHINVIESAARGKLRETGHSRILVDLLQHPILQQSFTKLFLGVELPFLQVEANSYRNEKTPGGSDRATGLSLFIDRLNSQKAMIIHVFSFIKLL